MSTREQLIRELEALPEPVLAELLDYLRFIKAKLARERCDTAIASEPVLARDWLRPEEDAAWGDL
ncbi:MAG: DUF2281 domain-containing protein [Planctomycetota bacterium]